MVLRIVEEWSDPGEMSSNGSFESNQQGKFGGVNDLYSKAIEGGRKAELS